MSKDLLITKNNYIIVGDSITYGIGGYQQNGWVSILKNKLLNKEGTKESTNYVHCVGFPGATSKEILKKFESIVATYYSSDMNNIIMVSIGVNDTQIFKGTPKTNIDEYKSNIIKIIDFVKKKSNCNIVFVGLTSIKEKSEPFFWKTDKYYDYNIINDYDNILREVCNKNGVKYIPMIDVLTEDDFIDGLHPNDFGYTKIYEKILLSIDEF